jgi:hypothetical protein
VDILNEWRKRHSDTYERSGTVQPSSALAGGRSFFVFHPASPHKGVTLAMDSNFIFFAIVMLVIVIGGIIVYKKSA